jgi:hypothetical protein
MTEEFVEIFDAGMLRIIDFYLEHGCPCRFPRFRSVVGFNFEDHGIAPHALHETQTLIAICTRHEKGMYTQEGNPEEEIRYTCSVCGAAILEEYDEYSISMWRSFLRIETVQHDLGPAPLKPEPLYWGPYGIDTDQHVDVINNLFTQTENFEDYISYMTELVS